jgi:putative ABC transport system permease protein
MGIAEYWTPNLTGTERPEELRGIRLSAGMLPLLGVRPLLGRAFLPDEEHAGRERVAVLRHDFWRTRFGADPGIIGHMITLDGEPHTIVGVMPPGFRFVPYWAADAQVAAPLVLDARRTDRKGASLRAFGRLAPGVTLAQARRQLASIAARLEQEYPGTNVGVTAVPLRDIVVGDVRPALLILLAAVGLVLLIACANVAHLQLMRSAARERELAVRAALGGSRGRLVRQSLVESAVLAGIGAVLGLALAHVGVRLLGVVGPANLPRLDAIRMDMAALGFLAAVTVVAAGVFGLPPALAAMRVDVHRGLKEGGRSASDSPRRRRMRSALVVSEFAMALLLLVGAGLVMRSFLELLRVDAGFDRRNVLSMTVSLSGTRHAAAERRTPFFRELVDRVRDLPGVQAASAINHLPLRGDAWRLPVIVEGQPVAAPGEGPSAMFRVVRPGYFRTMRIPLRRGRDFTLADEASSARVVIVSEEMARRRWPGENPLGKRITIGDGTSAPDWFAVVGVVRDAKQTSWSDASPETMYFPHLPAVPDSDGPPTVAGFLSPSYMTLVLRTGGDPAELAAAVARTVRALEPDAPVADIITMEQAIDSHLAQPRFYLLLLGAFAAVAVILAAVGVYGVISYSVTRRRHEIGVRMALGATRGDAFRLIVHQGMRLAMVGGAIGLVGALGATRFLRTLLFGVRPDDPPTFGLVTVALALVALAACAVPALKASRVDPAIALRAD